MQRKNIIIILLISLWSILQFIASEHFDMRISIDSDLYISGANDMINGEFPTGREILYFSYMFILAILSLLNVGYENVIYIHFLTAIIAIYSTYQLAIRLTNDNITAVFAPLLYILWIKFQQWNLILYTDAIFSHMVIISIYALVRFRNIKELVFVILLILFTSFLRPTGLGLLFAVLIYFVNKLIRNKKFKLYPKLITLALLTSFFAWLLNSVLNNFIASFIESYKIAEIIYPKINLIVAVPEILYIPDIDHQPLTRLFFIYHQKPNLLYQDFNR